MYGALVSVAVLWRPRSHRGILLSLLSDDGRLTSVWRLTSVCLSHTSGLSREQRDHRKTKIDTEVAHVTSPGQNATGQNATNSGICFYFLQMLFPFVAIPFNMSQPLVISAHHKLCFAHTTLITGTTPRHRALSIEHEGMSRL